MKGIKQIISILLALAITMSMVTIPALAEETAEIEKVITDNTVLTEPFDVTNEEEVDAGLYPYDEKTVLVKFAKKTKTLDVDGIASIEYLFRAKDGFWYTAHLADGTTPKMAIEALRSTSSVLVAEYNFLYETGATTLCDNEGVSDDVKNNGKSKDQWHLDSCGFQKAWKKLKNDKKNPGGDSGVIVAVIDTGVDFDHEDLKNNMWTNQGEVPGDGIDNDKNGYVDDYYGVNIVAKKGNGDDDHGHGTHVAGIIAAGNNNVGVVGLAYNTKIMAIKAGQASGYFLNTDVCKAIDYARENGADVINMSFGSTATTIAVQDALEEAYTHSVLVAAAGNDGMNNEPTPINPIAKPCYPAAYSFVLGVMAVDDFGVESSFTNYDVYGFNSVEYELYAPGNAITSTIPNDKYATWNGTSMAAPIVSAMAAVLRSEYNDPDKYPTKFIYGQLASTSERHAECLNPDKHGKHNIPQIANLYDALYKLPHPEISVSDYKTFDTSDISDENNGDGTIDSGETITLGFELRNRWGMSEDTIVTIDAKSQADIPNPYVEFSTDGKKFSKSASVDYGSVGTYSTQDCGKIIENDLWIGWEKPFYVKVAKDAPNETILAINVTITSKNALDEKDKSIYSSDTTIELIVKNGIVLPQIIDEDMTLTKDNYYIIQNATVIEEGATVTVTEGANIQFWTNDSTDPYADKYMAGLVVKGKLNCVGTEEEPVKIFPSNLMGNYRVEIYESGNGEINYNYTNITNLHTGGNSTSFGFTTARNCEFKQNYKTPLNYRYLENGVIKSSSSNVTICGETTQNSAFYKLGGATEYSDYPTKVMTSCENCIFVDSAISFDNAYTYNNCVFYGNNNYWDDTVKGAISNIGPYKYNYYFDYQTIDKVVKDEVTGKIYIQLRRNQSNNASYTELRSVNKLAEYMGGTVVQIETKEEFEFLKKSDLCGMIGMEFKDGKYLWLNGEEAGEFISVSGNSSASYPVFLTGNNMTHKSSVWDSVNSKYYVSALIELPGDIDIKAIQLEKGKTKIDTSETYRLQPVIYPVTARGKKLMYFSSNEAVATVDENGLVTPVDEGIATIYVFSDDMQIFASMEFDVEREVKIEEINVPEKIYIDIENTKTLNVEVYPAEHTKKLTYKSSDEEVVTVDENGNITAISQGVATVTVTAANSNEQRLEASIKIYSSVPATGIDIRDVTYIDIGNTKALNEKLAPVGVMKEVTYESSNEGVISVDENGNISSLSEGTSIITITAHNDNNTVTKKTLVYSCAPVTEIFSPEAIEIDIGTKKQMEITLTPSTSVKKIVYESSDESIATVDSKGNITAISDGFATITATVENDSVSISTETEVHVVVPVTKVEFDRTMFYIAPGQTTEIQPIFTPHDATYQTVVCDTSNPEICYVDEDGVLIGVSEGLATIKMTAEDTDVSAYITVCVSENYNDTPKIVKARYHQTNGNTQLKYIITEDGNLWQWGTTGGVGTGKLTATYVNPSRVDLYCEGEKIEIADIVSYEATNNNYVSTADHRYIILDKDGCLYSYIPYYNEFYVVSDRNCTKLSENVSHIVANVDSPYPNDCIVIMQDGSVMVFGHNSSGKLGVGGIDQYIEEGAIVRLDTDEKVVDGYSHYNKVWLLTENGNLYVSGFYNGTSYESFTKIFEGIKYIKNGHAYTDSEYLVLYATSTEFSSIKNSGMIDDAIYLENGKVYYKKSYTTIQLNLENVKDVIRYNYSSNDECSCFFFITEDDSLYYLKGGTFNESSDPEYVKLLPFYQENAPTLRLDGSNLTDVIFDQFGDVTSSVLEKDKLVLDFGMNLIKGNSYNNISLRENGTQVSIKKSVDLNRLTVVAGGGFIDGAEYVLSVPSNSFANDSGLFNSKTIVEFTYKPTKGIVTPKEIYLDTGNTKEIDVTIEPGVTVDNVEFESSDENIVTVDDEGNITGVSDGTAVIYATFHKSDEIVEKEITVYSYAPVTEVKLSEKTYIDLNNAKPIDLKITPASSLKRTTYESSDESVVFIDVDGNIKSVAEGSAVITATVYNDNESFEVKTTVYSYKSVTKITVPSKTYVDLGNTKPLSITLTPDNVVKNVTYHSSDENVVSVDENGNIKGITQGTAIITIKVLNDNQTITATTTVYSSIPVTEITAPETMIIPISSNTYHALAARVIPAETNKEIVFTSSDKSVATVSNINGYGRIYPKGLGYTTIISSVENDDGIVTAETLVHIVNATESIDIKEDHIITKIGEETYVSTPEILPSNATIKTYKWTSSDESICYVDENGKLIKNGIGVAVLTVTSDYSQYMQDTVTVVVMPDDFVANDKDIKHIQTKSASVSYALLEDNTIWKWNTTDRKQGNVRIAEKLNVDFDGTIDNFFVSVYYNKLFILSGSTMYESDQLNKDVISGFVVSKGDTGSVVGDRDVILDNVVEMSVYGDTCYITCLRENRYYQDFGNTGYNFNSWDSMNGTDIYVDDYYDTSTYSWVEPTKYILYGNSVYVLGDYNGMYYDEETKILDNISSINGGYAQNWNNNKQVVMGDTNKKYISWEYNKYLTRLTDNKYVSYYLDEWDNKLTVKLAMSIDEITNEEFEWANDEVLENVVQVFDKDNVSLGYDYDGEISALYYETTDHQLYAWDCENTPVQVIFDMGYDDEIVSELSNTILIGTEATEALTMSLPGNITEVTANSEGKTSDESDEHIHEFTTETIMPTTGAEGKITNTCQCGVTAETVLPKLTERDEFTEEDYSKAYNEFVEKGFNTNVSCSAILNRLIYDDVAKWLRITAPTGEAKYGFGGNYWGTTNPELINHQIVDYNDFITLGDINEGEFLTTAPENTFPFVTEAYLTDESGEVQSIVSGGKVKFVVKFNRDMDTEYGLNVYFGSTYPYADYEIYGEFTDARTWVGETELKTVIENGYQFIRVTNGRTAADENGAHLKLYDDWARFGFEIDTTTAMAMMMQGYADNDGIHLEWMQDDYDTLAGYNVYRADSEDGNYVRINKTIIPSDENTFTDADVEPGKKYYYTFTVVLTDATDSKPAGKISVTAKDTMAPNVYHSPVYTATTGSKVIISATVSDNIGIENAKLYYRVKGTDEWKTLDMSKSNSKYTASIPAAFVTTEGVEYYIAAFDGVNYTYAGSHTSENPYEITVYQAVENNAKGDVDGDGNITVLDALKLLRAIYDESLLTQEEFLRADINGDGSLSAVEALRILQYANKSISSVLW